MKTPYVSLFRRFTDTNVSYTEPVSLNYGKLATKHLRYGLYTYIFLQCIYVVAF